MPLSLNEIRTRAIAFSQEWKHEGSEDAEAKTFWDQFFNIFGIPRRRVASFEHHIPKQDGREGYIDLLWKGTLLVEHKSRGKDLSRAYRQASDYFPGLKDHELPKYVIVCDFDSFKLYNLDEGEKLGRSISQAVLLLYCRALSLDGWCCKLYEVLVEQRRGKGRILS